MSIVPEGPIGDVELSRSLWLAGYFEPCNPKTMFPDTPLIEFSQKRNIDDAVALYQSAYNSELVVDGHAGPLTRDHVNSRSCRVPDRMMEAQSAWPRSCMKEITCSHRLAGLKPLSSEEENQAWLEALSNISAVSGINLVNTDDHERSHIYADVGSMGRGTLAWSYLPNGNCSDRMEQQYNRSKNWSYALLLEVMVHELLHACGLGHSDDQNSIMHPTVTGRFTSPQTWEIQELQERYGEPETPGPSGGQKVGSFVFNGKTYDIVDPEKSTDVIGGLI